MKYHKLLRPHFWGALLALGSITALLQSQVVAAARSGAYAQLPALP
jgi:hypothetical protein